MAVDQCASGEASSNLPKPFDSLVLSRLLAGWELGDQMVEAMSEEFQPIARTISALERREDRREAFQLYRKRHPDPDGLVRCLRRAGELPPFPPVMTAKTRPSADVQLPQAPAGGSPRILTERWVPASARDLSQSSKGVRWIWKDWISRGRIAGLAGFEGTGKTRFALDLARRAYHGLSAPDGRSLEVPIGSPSMWICADGHQDELATSAQEMGIPPEAILFNAQPDEPYDGIDLDSDESLYQLEGFLSVSKAPLVFVDTLTNATRRDLCRQSDVKSLLSPLLSIAQRQDVAIILLLHLSREGHALGRRVKGLTRTLLHLECPSPDTEPGRLRLWVEKSFAVKPPPLGVTMTADGNLYDANPPERSDRDRTGSGTGNGTGVGRPPEKIDKAIEFLVAELSDGDRKAVDLVSAWQAEGEAKASLFRARNALVESGRLVVDDSSRPQIWHLTGTN
jgi:hypothetical protein